MLEGKGAGWAGARSLEREAEEIIDELNVFVVSEKHDAIA
jgi:hypothetical protein